MKQTLQFFAIFLTMWAFSTQAQVLLNEDFGSGTFPPAGWTISAQSANWSAVSTSNAGGSAPEARLNWSPQFNATSRLQSPSLDLSANESGQILISFRHMVDHYGGPYTIGLAYSENEGPWQNLWTIVNPTADVPAQVVSLQLTEEDFPVNGSDVKIALFFSGASFNINFWYIDDVSVIIPTDFDLALSELHVPQIFEDAQPIAGKVENLGLETITTFDLNWQINDGEVITETFDGLSLEFGESLHFETEGLIDEEPGTYTLNVFLSNINGEEADDNPDNDSIQQTISFPSATVAYRPLFESFSSSTCPPCAPFNTNVMNPFVANNIDNLSIIKYQMNWPGSGDPYYTPEGGVRRNYYGVSGVPSLVVDGSFVSTNAGAVNNAFQAGLAREAFLELSGESSMDGTVISIDVEVNPFVTLSGVRLHVVVVEKTTYGNATSNGETEFHYVMMKMLPNAEGTTIDLVDGETFTASFSHDMANTHVEDFDDLAVVLFVQDHASQTVFQSAFTAHEADFIADFDITNDQEDVAVDGIVNIFFNMPVMHTDESEITNDNVASLVTYQKMAEKQDVAFTATISEDKDHINITPNEALEFNSVYWVELAPVMAANGTVTEPISISFTTRESAGAPVVTISLDDGAENVPVDQVITIELNQSVRLSNGSEITPENIAEVVIYQEDDMSGSTASFSAVINDEKTLITVTPEGNLTHNQLYVFGVDQLLGVDDELSDPVTITFTTEDNVSAGLVDASLFKLYPNPASHTLNIDFPQELAGAEIRLFDAAGQLVVSKKLSGNKMAIDLQGLANGVYLFEVTAEGFNLSRRVIISR